jgi:signal transduction histidine kinase/ActR/RegA family two-component response regulator
MAPAKAGGIGAGIFGRSGRDIRHIVFAAIVATALVVGSAGALLVYVGASINEIRAEREVSLLANALERKEDRIRDDVTSATVWNDAYEHTTEKYDAAWADENFGVYYSQYMHHDETIVVDAQGGLIYASKDGEATPLANVAAFRVAAGPLIAQARAEEARRVAAKPRALSFDRAGVAKGAFKVGNEVFIGVASTVAPEESFKGPLAPRSAIVVSAMKVDAEFLRGLETDYSIKGAFLSLSAPRDRASTPLNGLDGKPLGYVAWTPEQPAARVFADAWAAIAVLGVLVALALAALIFHIRRLAGRLVLAKEAAEAADEAKSAFLANMSHEIRTPLNGVLGMTQVMEADELSPAQRERVGVIRESGRALLAILNDVLDLSKVEAGKLELEPAEFYMGELANAVCSTFEGSAAARDLSLLCEVGAEARGVWVGDALRLRQILSNLVSNAIKFTHQGSVALRVGHDGKALTFAVQDTGIGIDADKIPQLFQKFSQADASTTRRYGGTGLGLAISRELVELMGGHMEVTSEPGQGSCFAFRLVLPRGRSAPLEAAAIEPVEAPDQALRILAAEDNPTNQLVLRALLQPFGAEVVIVDDGAAAVRAFEAQRFDLVLMDVQMPVMNGVEATEAIRQFETRAHRPRTPILALSANVMTHQIAEYRAAGMDDYVAKPIELDKLIAAMDAVLGDEEGAGDRGAHAVA